MLYVIDLSVTSSCLCESRSVDSAVHMKVRGKLQGSRAWTASAKLNLWLVGSAL